MGEHCPVPVADPYSGLVGAGVKWALRLDIHIEVTQIRLSQALPLKVPDVFTLRLMLPDKDDPLGCDVHFPQGALFHSSH